MNLHIISLECSCSESKNPKHEHLPDHGRPLPLHRHHHHLRQDHCLQVLHGDIRKVTHQLPPHTCPLKSLQILIISSSRISLVILDSSTSAILETMSYRSQILFLLVFLTRYIDVFTHFISIYNTSIKIFFIISTLTNIYLVFVKYAGTISSDLDTFRYRIENSRQPEISFASE